MPLGATVGGGGDKGEGAGDGGAAPSTIISSNGLNNHNNNNSDKSSSSSSSGSARGGGGASTVHGGADKMGDGGLGRGMQAVISLAYEEDERKNISAAEAISNYCINGKRKEKVKKREERKFTIFSFFSCRTVSGAAGAMWGVKSPGSSNA